MTQTSYFWNGTTGDASAAPWNEDEFSDILRMLFLYEEDSEGIIGGYGNMLTVSNPVGTTIRVGTGAALVYSRFYENTANLDFVRSAPGSNTDWYRWVIRVNWSAKTVRSTFIGPNNAVGPSYPALTRTYGVTWEIPLADVSITSGGVVTITDQRQFTRANGYQIPLVKERLGLSTLSWSLAASEAAYSTYRWRVGSTTYMQCGCKQWTGGAAATGNIAITFPKAYDYEPMVFVQPKVTSPTIIYNVVTTTTGFTIYWRDTTGTRTAIDFMWWSLGVRITGGE